MPGFLDRDMYTMLLGTAQFRADVARFRSEVGKLGGRVLCVYGQLSVACPPEARAEVGRLAVQLGIVEP